MAACPPRPTQIDWILGSPKAQFSGYAIDRSPLVRRTTDHPVVLAQVTIDARSSRTPTTRGPSRPSRSGPGARAQRARRLIRSTSWMTTERGSRRSHPREAKSASALLTVSREAPTSWASSSWVRSWCTCTPSSAVRPKRSARSSSALATRPGTSEKTRSATTSLVLRSRPASWVSRPRETPGRPSSQRSRSSWESERKRGLGDGGDGRRPRAGVEERQLAEHLAGAEDRQQVLAAVRGGAAELHLALGDDVELVARVALVEEHLAATQPVLAHRGAQCSGRLVVEGTEQRRLPEYVVIHVMSLHCRAARRRRPRVIQVTVWPIGSCRSPRDPSGPATTRSGKAFAGAVPCSACLTPPRKWP